MLKKIKVQNVATAAAATIGVHPRSSAVSISSSS